MGFNSGFKGLIPSFLPNTNYAGPKTNRNKIRSTMIYLDYPDRIWSKFANLFRHWNKQP